MFSILVFIIFSLLGMLLSILFTDLAWYWPIVIIIIDLLLLIAVEGLIATICCKKVNDNYFSKNKRIFRTTKKESRFYELTGVKLYKDHLLDLGFLNGFNKANLDDAYNKEYIGKYILELKKGALTHLLGLFIGMIICFIMPPKMYLTGATCLVIGNFLLNFTTYGALKYNLPRLETLYKYLERKEKKAKKNTTE